MPFTTTLAHAPALLRLAVRPTLLSATLPRATSALTRLNLSFSSTAVSSVVTTTSPPSTRSTSFKPPRGPPSPPSLEPHELYANPRRWHSIGLTTLAVLQAGFWAGATSLSTQVTSPLLPPIFTFLGLGLSAGFAAMIAIYLRRSVAHVLLLNGPILRIIPNGLAGSLSNAYDVDPALLRPGPHADDPKQRHWTFGVMQPSGRTKFFIVDTRHGVRDREGLAAVARGGEHLMAWSLQRDAALMKTRWRNWQESTPSSSSSPPPRPQ